MCLNGERDEKMKKLKQLILAGLMLVVSGMPLAVRAQVNEFYVQDQANVLTQAVKEEISAWNETLEKTKEKPQVVVMTLPNLGGDSIEVVAAQQFERLKIGDKDLDNGVLILLALEERRVRIEVGYGLEGAITDSLAGRILDNHLSLLKEDNYSEGLLGIFEQVLAQIVQEYGYELEGLPETMVEEGHSVIVFLIFIFLLLFVCDKLSRGGGGRSSGHRYYEFDYPGSSGSSSFGGGGSSGGGGASAGF